MKKISEHIIGLRNAQMDIFLYFCEEMRKRDVNLSITESLVSEFHYLDSFLLHKSTSYYGFKISVLSGDFLRSTEISFYSFTKKHDVYNGFKITFRSHWKMIPDSGVITKLCPIEYLDNERFINELARFYSGNGDFKSYLKEQRKDLDPEIWG